MTDVEKIILKKLKKLFSQESSGHDLMHLIRTRNIVEHLQKKEGGDKEVILISALLHDVHRLIQKENRKYCQPKDSLPTIKNLLKNLKLDDEAQDHILHCVEFHEEYGFTKNGKSVNDIETLILQDADNLDAIGAIGIARAFTYGGANNCPIWNPNIPLKSPKHYEESNMDDSEIHHFYNKLLKLKDNMNTKTGRKMAEKRHEFMEKYLEEFFKEWKGVK